MPLNDIVNVIITRQTQTVSEAGFGSLMILGTFKNWTSRIRRYSDMQEVALDFSPFQREYIAASNVFSQTISPEFIYIGRRSVDEVGILVETAMAGHNYTVTINDIAATIFSTSLASQSSVTLSSPPSFIPGNLVNVSLNNELLGTVTSVIDFDIDFVSLNSILATINGVALNPVIFSGNQPTTIALLAAEISTDASVASAIVSGARQITVVFNSEGTNTVNSVITTLGATQPTATISEGAFQYRAAIINFDIDFVSLNSIEAEVNGNTLTPVIFSVDQATTIALLAAMIQTDSTVLSATVIAPRQIAVVFNTSGANVVDSVITTLGATQPVATITYRGGPYISTSLGLKTAIANAITAKLNETYTPGVATAIISGTANSIITVFPNPNQSGVINSFVTTLATTQPTATINTITQPTSQATIADALATEINSVQSDVIATTPSNPDGTLTLTAAVSDVPYTVSVSTNIITPDRVKINIAQTIPNLSYTIIINGTQFIYTAPNDVTDDVQIAAGLVEEINALYPLPPDTPIAKRQPVTATNNGDGSLEIVADVAGTGFNIQVFPPEAITAEIGLIIGPYVPSDTVTNDLNAISAENDDWYALATTSREVATVQAIAAWVESRVKLFGTASDDLDIINEAAGVDTTSIAAFLNSNGYVRTFVLYHQDSQDDYPEAAWFGAVLPTEPGSETWMFKTLNTIAYSNLTSNQQNNVLSKNANIYTFVAGVGITANGTVAQGEYIDIIRGIDWLTARIQEFVFSVLVNNLKVPYTDAGIAVIEAEVKRALSLGISNDFLASDPAPQTFVPRAIDVPPVDKANRILRNVRFTATLAGAIHAVRISGQVSV